MRRFDWDPAKNTGNIAKHGIGFEQAVRIFEGPVVTATDDRHEYGEIREISLGKLDGMVVLVVVHTDRNGVTRIISARRANRGERERYEEKLRSAAERG